MKITYKDFKRLDELFSNARKDFKEKEWAKIGKDFAENTKDLVKLLEEEFDSAPVVNRTSIYDVIVLPEGQEGQEGQIKKLQEAYNATKEKMQSSKYAKYYLSELKIEDYFIDKIRIEISFFIKGFESDITRRFSEMNIEFNFVHHK
jgi:hypothetical protein